MQTVNARTRRRWKLRRLLRKYPDLLNRLSELRAEGFSYSELSIELAKITDEYVDPTVIRDWLKEFDGGREV